MGSEKEQMWSAMIEVVGEYSILLHSL